MSDWALLSCERQEFFSAVASRGAANAKGAYAELTASTSFPYQALTIQLVGEGGGGQTYLVDIAVGPSGSETVIVPNILLDTARGIRQNMVTITVPVSVPAGSRLAVRCQEESGSGTRNVNATLIGRGGGHNYAPAVGGSAVDYGTITASTNGTLVDPGAVANTYGAWTEITSGTSRDHAGLTVVLGTNKQTGALIDSTYYFQVGIGPAGSETPICEFMSAIFASGNRCQVNTIDILSHIPSGTRLAMRSKCVSSSAAGARHTTAIILGY